MLNGNNLSTLLTGGIGTLAVTAADQISMPAPEDIQSLGQLFIQVIIGIITIWKMVKKPKPKQGEE
jgi:hypothetical protein